MKAFVVIGHQWGTYESDHAEVYGNKVYATREEAIAASNAAAKQENEDENAWTHDLLVKQEQGDKYARVHIDEQTGSHEWLDNSDGRGYALWVEECECDDYFGLEVASKIDTPSKANDALAVLEQAVRNQLSNLLIDTSEEHPMEVDVEVKAGPYEMDTVKFNSAYMMPGDGRIFFHDAAYPMYDEDSWHDFDIFHLDDKVSILNQMQP